MSKWLSDFSSISSVTASPSADNLSALGEAVTKEMVENNLAHLENLKQYYENVKNIVQNPKSLLNGNEIMQILNIKPSKIIGEIIEELKELQLSNEIKNKEEATLYVKNKAAKGLFNGTKN